MKAMILKALVFIVAFTLSGFVISAKPVKHSLPEADTAKGTRKRTATFVMIHPAKADVKSKGPTAPVAAPIKAAVTQGPAVVPANKSTKPIAVMTIVNPAPAKPTTVN